VLRKQEVMLQKHEAMIQEKQYQLQRQKVRCKVTRVVPVNETSIQLPRLVQEEAAVQRASAEAYATQLSVRALSPVAPSYVC
jgi:hypothetical protein